MNIPWCNCFDKPVEDVNEQEALDCGHRIQEVVENMNVIHCDECLCFCYKEVDEEGDD